MEVHLHPAAGAAKRKLHCIRDLPRNSQAVLCAAIVLMGMELKPKVPAHNLLRCLPDAVLPSAGTVGCVFTQLGVSTTPNVYMCMHAFKLGC